MTLPLTPSQTIGPFFHVALPVEGEGVLVDPASPDAVRIRGQVFDGTGAPVDDALIEVWQLKPIGFGRVATDAEGRFEFVTGKPAAVDNQAPHLALSVFARGLLDRLVTRIYFPDEDEANAADPVLSSITDPGARATLVAVADDDTGGLRFDIHLQGERETVFFAV